MKEETRAKAGLVYNVVESVILAMSVGLLCWIGNRVIAHGELLASHTAQITADTIKLDNLDTKGSRGLESATKRIDEDERRLDKIEAAILSLQTAPGELKAINARLDGIEKGQARIEKSLEDHMREGRTNK